MLNKIQGSNVLITGGAGFIGSFVVEELLKFNPNKIVIIDNLSRGSYENMKGFIKNPCVEFIEEDIRNTAILDNNLKQMDYVFHMAALRINACAASPKDGFDVMIKSTFELAELCVKYHIKKVIYSSSASVYGLAQNFPTPETDHPYDNQTFYGAAKLWGEQLWRSYKFMYGLDYVALRYFNVYGPRMDTDGKYTEVMIKWLDCIKDGVAPNIYGDGSTSMDLVNVKDVAKANVAALLSPITDEVLNIGSNKETSLKQLLQLLLSINESTISPRYLEENTVNPVSRRVANNQKAFSMINFEPTVSLNEGLLELSQRYFQRKTS